MNTPVNFELAKLLKEKGFDEQNLTIYQDGEVLLLRSTISNSQFMTSRNYTAPTIAEVVMWLYEKHDIWIDVSLNQFSKPKDLQWMYSIVFTKDCTYSHSPKSYSSPTKSYEVAIEYCLRNII